MSGTKRNLPDASYKASVLANLPSGVNPFATIADVLAMAGGNRVISGSAAYSGTGFTYNVTALNYVIQGIIYASAATNLTFAPADPTLDRIDVIYADNTGAVGIITGTPAATPSKPSVDSLTQVEVTFVTIPAGATAPSITIVNVYDEFAGTGGGEWNASTTSSAALNATANPYSGTTHISTTAPFPTNSNIAFTDPPYTINGGQVTFWMNAKSSMTSPATYIRVGFFVGGSLVGLSVKIGGTPATTYGFNGGIVGTYQLVTIPISAFGVLPTTIDELRFFTTPGPSGAQFDLDLIKIEESAAVPLPSGAVWSPTALTLGDFTLNGVSAFNAIGAGHLFTFDPGQNDELLVNVGLDRNGLPYDGSDLELELHWMLFSAPGAGDTVRWELDYAFTDDGSDNYTDVDGTVVLSLPVDTRVQRSQYSDKLPVISGPPGSTTLQLTLRRVGTADTYGGDADLYSVHLNVLP